MINYDVIMITGKTVSVSGRGIADALNKNNIDIMSIFKIIPVSKMK